MKSILYATSALIALGACAPKVQQMCEDVYIDKLNPSERVCTDVAVGWSYWMQPTPDHMDPKDRPNEPNEPNEPDQPDHPSDPDTPDTPDTPDGPSVPDGPSGPSNPDKPDRVKGNNGWGNGDQSAPGNSGPNNNAENDRGGRSQRNHGSANSN